MADLELLKQIKEQAIRGLNGVAGKPVDEVARDTAAINTIIDALNQIRNISEQAIKKEEDAEKDAAKHGGAGEPDRPQPPQDPDKPVGTPPSEPRLHNKQ